MKAWAAPSVPALPGPGATLRLYDSATGSMRTVPPAGVEETRMYVCGITPYDATHLGHASTYLTFDVLQRVWRDAGLQVRYTQNITDVDDPLLERAARDGEDWRELAEREIALYREDMAALRVLPPTDFVGVTESIDLIADAVSSLRERGATYDLDGDIYFSVDTDPHFGSVAHWSRDRMIAVSAERGGDPERPGKKNPLDPLLWRAERPDEPSWSTRVGRGRPGWHIECTAIALDTLGSSFDVQGGGNDLTFPHHEMSASHASLLTEAHPFARAFVHVGMVGLDGEKMSKSQGNLVFVSVLREQGVDPSAIRLMLLAHPYQQDWSYTHEALEGAQRRLARWRTACAAPGGPAGEAVLASVREVLARDLDTVGAIEIIDEWAAAVLEASESTDATAPGLVAAVADALLGVQL